MSQTVQPKTEDRMPDRRKGGPVRGIVRLLIRIFFRPRVEFESEEAKRAAQEDPCILICNHVRGFDSALLQTVLPKRAVYSMVAKDMIDGNRVLKIFSRYTHMISVDRNNASWSWMRSCKEVLKAGDCVFFAPEGRCNKAKVMRPFKAGFITVAAMSGVKVLPIYHNGEYHILHGKRARVLIGDPIAITPAPLGLRQAEMDRETVLCQNKVQALEKQLLGYIHENEFLPESTEQQAEEKP